MGSVILPSNEFNHLSRNGVDCVDLGGSNRVEAAGFAFLDPIVIRQVIELSIG